ncbi:hypothetical protein NDN08_006434 [Rhodosorus marinus]|uniref:Gustatory receptor n=1 Tax=Rhodosorus marinus TaxID=101924 RepID=A0AAV8UL39_9RHOD|nr:hypothetical protein NDN08_006434 [Rhodosorus marinus]
MSQPPLLLALFGIESLLGVLVAGFTIVSVLDNFANSEIAIAVSVGMGLIEGYAILYEAWLIWVYLELHKAKEVLLRELGLQEVPKCILIRWLDNTSILVGIIVVYLPVIVMAVTTYVLGPTTFSNFITERWALAYTWIFCTLSQVLLLAFIRHFFPIDAGEQNSKEDIVIEQFNEAMSKDRLRVAFNNADGARLRMAVDAIVKARIDIIGVTLGDLIAFYTLMAIVAYAWAIYELVVASTFRMRSWGYITIFVAASTAAQTCININTAIHITLSRAIVRRTDEGGEAREVIGCTFRNVYNALCGPF